MTKPARKAVCRCGHAKSLHWDFPTRNYLAYVKKARKINPYRDFPMPEVIHFCESKSKDTLTDMCRCLKYRPRTARKRSTTKDGRKG